MFAVAKRLSNSGVLGLNQRNSDFIMRLNPRHLYPRVDDKVITKQSFEQKPNTEPHSAKPSLDGACCCSRCS